MLEPKLLRKTSDSLIVSLSRVKTSSYEMVKALCLRAKNVANRSSSEDTERA